MSDQIMISVTGFTPENEENEVTIAEGLIQKKTAISIFPQMINSMGGYVGQIEDSEHPLNGMEIVGVQFSLVTEEEAAFWPKNFWKVEIHDFEEMGYCDDDD